MKFRRYPENKKANNPNKDVTFIYESGGRDIEEPFSGDALEDLADETEGSWEIDLRNTSDRKRGGYPEEEKQSSDEDYIADEQEYPFYYSKKGAPRGEGYPREQDWWQKALSSIEILSLLKPSAEEILDCTLRFKAGDQRKSQLWGLISRDEELTQQLASRIKEKKL